MTEEQYTPEEQAFMDQVQRDLAIESTRILLDRQPLTAKVRPFEMPAPTFSERMIARLKAVFE